jgi:aerotaxis receptor
MNVRPIQPLQISSDFRFEELFFSTTDLKGKILSSNRVFVRVSGYQQEELYGQPHNIIRHPDMPRAVFALLWDNLKRGLPFAGYVKNMAKDGRYYWVFAVIVAAGADRFLSVRFKPSSSLMPQAEALYRETLAAENGVLQRGGTEKEAVQAGLQLIHRAMKVHGSYDLFSHAALNREIKARDAQLARSGAHLFPRTLPGEHGMACAYDSCVKVYDQVNGLFQSLDGFVESASGLQEKALAVLDTAEVFRLHALNVKITSGHHGDSGRCVGVVASFLGDHSRELTEGTAGLRSHISEISADSQTINARVAMARLQLEMLLFFQAESAAGAAGVDLHAMQTLEECFLESSAHLETALGQLDDHLPKLLQSRENLARTALAIEMTQVCGLTETARIPQGEDLRTMFSEFRTRIGTTRSQLDDLSNVIDNISSISRVSPPRLAAINLEIQAAARALHGETSVKPATTEPAASRKQPGGSKNGPRPVAPVNGGAFQAVSADRTDAALAGQG